MSNRVECECPWCLNMDSEMYGSWWNLCINCGCIYVALSKRIDREGLKISRKVKGELGSSGR